ncbi:hypothetical protein BT69DRAFT_808047 [Atractiella rhizophila]|nr:hypothetical protein BT69DRAFT_808047 [Atractiella rhizophila]
MSDIVYHSTMRSWVRNNPEKKREPLATAVVYRKCENKYYILPEDAIYVISYLRRHSGAPNDPKAIEVIENIIKLATSFLSPPRQDYFQGTTTLNHLVRKVQFWSLWKPVPAILLPSACHQTPKKTVLPSAPSLTSTAKEGANTGGAFKLPNSQHRTNNLELLANLATQMSYVSKATSSADSSVSKNTAAFGSPTVSCDRTTCPQDFSTEDEEMDVED